MTKLNSRQEAFAREVVLNGGDKVAAFKASGWKWENFNTNTLSKEADSKYNHPKIYPRIQELQKEADEIAKQAFTITVKQRLEWLKDITEAGLSTYEDQLGNKRRESLTAARSAIETMNTMLGSGDEDESGKSLTINFEVAPAVKSVKVTNAKT
jgi:hypothetical protein